MSFSLPAPAKINLFLHILGRRADGYHQLQTLFQFLEHADTLRFSAAEQLSFTCDQPALAGTDNLVWRAAEALRRETGYGGGARIALHKVLPCGGGLGGGSSDAATTLLALNELWQTGLSLSELAGIGLTLGADVPVFIAGQSAWAEGIGERLTPVIDLAEPWMLVLIPATPVATALIFNDPALTRDTPAITLSAFLAQGGRNDCEDTVCRHFPAVRSALSWLRQFGQATMTGTGACVFQACVDEATARRRLESAPCAGFVTQARTRSPLHVALAQLQSDRQVEFRGVAKR